MSAPAAAPRPPAARWPAVLAALLRSMPASAPDALARVADPWLGRRRAVALEQLARAFPELAPAEHERLWRESLIHHARSLTELAVLAGPPAQRARLVESVEIGGVEHADRARALAPGGRGVVVVTAHVGNWELCLAAMAAAGHAMAVVHHGLGRPGLAGWLAGVRTRSGDVELVELGAARVGEVLASVRAGRHLVAMMDQNARLDEGSFAPFFGAPACTRRGPVLVALRLGVPLLPAFSHRVGAGPRHRVEFGPPIELERPERLDGDAVEQVVDAALTRVNCVIEEAIRAHPAQWIWSHRRHRTRPGPRDPAAREPASAPI